MRNSFFLQEIFSKNPYDFCAESQERIFLLIFPMNSPFLQCFLQQGEPLIFGILNVTTDSFSDGGDFCNPEGAIKRAEKMMEEGADAIDVGAESSAPGSQEISATQEWKRLEPVLSALSKKNIPFSVDTWKSGVAEKALKIGAWMVNDVTGLRGDPAMSATLAQFPEAYVCIMYSKNASARTTFDDYEEQNFVQKISSFFTERIQFCKNSGISAERIILDPGMGAFLSSDPQKSFTVLRRLEEFTSFKCPLLVSTSRKSFLREISDPNNPKNRMIASVVSSLIALQNGAQIVRVHDVKEMREAVDVWQSTQK